MRIGKGGCGRKMQSSLSLQKHSLSELVGLL